MSRVLMGHRPDASDRIQLERISYFAVMVAMLISPIASAASNQGTQDKRRPVTVEDCIGMVRLANGLYEMGDRISDQVVQWSPDRKRFVVALKKGNLKRNTVDYWLVLYDSDLVDKGVVRPKTIVRMASSSNRPAINKVKWISNTLLAFIGENPRELQQLYVFDLKTKAQRKLISWHTNIADYDITADLAHVIFLAEPLEQGTRTQAQGNDGLVVGEQQLPDLLEIADDHPSAGLVGQLFVRDREGKIHHVSSDEDLVQAWYPWDWWQLSLSPDGSHAIIQTRMTRIPGHWKQYTNSALQPFLKTEHTGTTGLFRYLVIDTKKYTAKPLLDSPNANGDLPRYVWAPDGKWIFASQIFLPLTSRNDKELEIRRERAFVAQINISDHRVIPITDKELSVEQWDASATELILRAGTAWSDESGSKVRYRRTSSGWQEANGISSHPLPSIREITLEEDQNTPPRIVAERPATGRKQLLLDLNPEFLHLGFSHVETIVWTGNDGTKTQGGLYLPLHYVPGRRYPLIIQTHGFDPKRFYIDGPFNTAFAAQPLAGHDFAVLQIGIDLDSSKQATFSSGEGPHTMAVIEGAVDYLAQRGIVDRNRVGLIGFSITAYDVQYTLTHSKYHFAAAAIADGLDGSYMQYMTWANQPENILDVRLSRMNDGPPFGENLARWLQSAPGFNVDKVRTPVRVTALTRLSILLMWEWFAGLSQLGKPVEMVYIKHGTHLLQRPSDRVISQQGNVDWFVFWLLGKEDPSPSKSGQYARWRDLRARYVSVEDTGVSAHK